MILVFKSQIGLNYDAIQNNYEFVYRVTADCQARVSTSLPFPGNTKHLYNICTILDQRLTKLYKCFVFVGLALALSKDHLVSLD